MFNSIIHTSNGYIHKNDNSSITNNIINNIEILEDFNFKKIKMLPNTWKFVEFGDYKFDQGLFYSMAEEKGYMEINSHPFTKTVSPQDKIYGEMDHPKLFMMNQKEFIVPTFGELVFNCKVSARILGLENLPFPKELVPDPNKDLRLAFTGIPISGDSSSMLMAYFGITNEMIYALYERAPINKTLMGGDYAAFLFAIPVASRLPNDFHDLSIVWSKPNKSISYLIDGKKVYEINRVGCRIDRKFLVYDVGGVDQEIFPEKLQVAFGNFDVLDAAPPIHNISSNQIPSQLIKGLVQVDPNLEIFNPMAPSLSLTYFDNQSLLQNRLFGQGIILNLKSIQIYYNK
ncbi:hypothetical protein DLAC_03130 [Tieghemostelium lacteum]|uniref:Uncharacterized protein n=1 Tax=Tieghemostelium lacteum TaxID=361077 RepID=A0A152A297_TIELA|nr:hypothetical protein DLAC_03130 [Tieghemostelium lacteum]|eukprot:KYR00382.1 hypothetical protein DLAC_03130 [Tieghemostelium lacteum]